MVLVGSDTDWVVLSGRAGAAGVTDMPAGVFTAELRLPLDGPQVLIDRRSADGTEVFSILHDPAHGLSLLHRRDARLTRHELAGPLPVGRATARITFGWDILRDLWRLEFALLGQGAMDAQSRSLAEGRGARGLGAPMLHALAEAQGHCHDAVLWYGVTRGAVPAPTPWIGPRSCVRTLRGPVAAEELQVGDVLVTHDGLVPVLHSARQTAPGRGSFQPVLLRAPWYGKTDLLVSAAQLVRLAGAEAEYLFGDEEVLVPAGYLIDGQSALAETRRAVVTGIALTLGGAELIDVQGCILCSEPPLGLTLPLRLLDRYEAVPLMAQMGRLPQRAVG